MRSFYSTNNIYQQTAFLDILLSWSFFYTTLCMMAAAGFGYLPCRGLCFLLSSEKLYQLMLDSVVLEDLPFWCEKAFWKSIRLKQRYIYTTTDGSLSAVGWVGCVRGAAAVVVAYTLKQTGRWCGGSNPCVHGTALESNNYAARIAGLY